MISPPGLKHLLLLALLPAVALSKPPTRQASDRSGPNATSLATCPPPRLSAPPDPSSLTNAAIAELLPAGRLEHTLACFSAALALPPPAPEALALIRDNARVLGAALAPPRHMMSRRLLHALGDRRPAWPPLHAPLPPPPRTDPAIYVADGALSRAQCEDAVALFEGSGALFEGNVMYNGQIIVDHKSKNRKEFDVSGFLSGALADGALDAGDAPAWAALERAAVSLLVRHLRLYEDANPLVTTLRSPFGDEGFRMVRYDAEAEAEELHDWHADGHQEQLGVPPRVLAAIIYLSDPPEGGETLFLNQGVAVRPQCGRVLIFPSAFPYLHAGRPVVEGKKYALTLMITT